MMAFVETCSVSCYRDFGGIVGHAFRYGNRSHGGRPAGALRVRQIRNTAVRLRTGPTRCGARSIAAGGA